MYINIVGKGAFTNDVSIFLDLFDPCLLPLVSNLEILLSNVNL